MTLNAMAAWLLWMSPISAAVSSHYVNLNDGLSTTPTGWTLSSAGAASRNGDQLNSAGGSITYSRAIAPDVAASIEGRVHGDAGGVLMWMTIGDFGNDEHIRIDARLEVSGDNKIVLYDFYDDASPKGEITLDWTVADPDVRVRLKRQEILGVPHVVLQGEVWKTGPGASPVVWDDPSNKNPNPDTATSIKVPLSSFSIQSIAFDEVGFGNRIAGAYDSFWEYVLVTEADDLTTELPYWPAVPPAPTVSFDDMGVDLLQAVDIDIDLSPLGYLVNDQALFIINADGIDILDPAPAVDPSALPGTHHRDFDNLADDQQPGGFFGPVTGWVEVTEVSGRSRMSPVSNIDIPDRTSPIGIIEVFESGGSDFVAPKASYDSFDQPTQIAVLVTERYLDETASSITINGTPQALAALTHIAVGVDARYTWDGPPTVQGSNTVVVDLVDLEGQSNAAAIQVDFDLALVSDGGPQGDSDMTGDTDMPGDADIPGDNPTPGDTDTVSPGDSVMVGDSRQASDPSDGCACSKIGETSSFDITLWLLVGLLAIRSRRCSGSAKAIQQQP